MTVPYRDEAQAFLEAHVKNTYQLHHARMVALAMEGYADIYKQDLLLWYVTGLLHDVDFEEHASTHPKDALEWFKKAGYPDTLIHAVEAHAYGYNGYTMLPQTTLAFALIATDEMSGLFYAYQKISKSAYADISVFSIQKKFDDPLFAAKIDRPLILQGCDGLGITLQDHIAHMCVFFKDQNLES